MPQPAIQSPVLASRFALPATSVAAATTLPIRGGFRPYTEKTRGKRPANIVWNRNLAAATAPGTAANLALFGAEWTSEHNNMGVDANGRIVPGYDPLSSSLNLMGVAPAGAYSEKIRVSGGAGTGIGFLAILNPGSGYDPASAPAVTFSGAGTAAATAIVSPDGRVTGLQITNAGTYSASATVTIAAPTSGVQAVAAISAGQVTTVYTHIPYAAHAPTTVGSAFWVAIWRDRIIACSSALLGTTANQPTAAQLGGMGCDADQHVIGLSTAPGFTVATGTHTDGTTTIGVLTLGVGIPNGDNIYVVRAPVKRLIPGTQSMGLFRHQVKIPDFMWVGVDTTAGATETSVLGVTVEAVTN